MRIVFPSEGPSSLSHLPKVAKELCAVGSGYESSIKATEGTNGPESVFFFACEFFWVKIFFPRRREEHNENT
jgi:hypothetical protein